MKSFNYSKLVQHRPNHPEEVDEDLFIVSIGTNQIKYLSSEN